MAIQELDLPIQHRSGQSNANADALSRCPLPSNEDRNQTREVVAVLQETTENSTDLENGNLPDLQRSDDKLAQIFHYLGAGVLLADNHVARQIALTSSRYSITDRVLYRVEEDSTLRVIPPVSCRRRLFEKAHGGAFGAHLSDVKVHSELRRHYWWDGMRKDITSWSRACLICATHSPGRRVNNATHTDTSIQGF